MLAPPPTISLSFCCLHSSLLSISPYAAISMSVSKTPEIQRDEVVLGKTIGSILLFFASLFPSFLVCVCVFLCACNFLHHLVFFQLFFSSPHYCPECSLLSCPLLSSAYSLLSCLTSARVGSFGKVIRGKCRGKDVAIKMLHKTRLDEETLVSFKKEVSIMRCLFLLLSFSHLCLLCFDFFSISRSTLFHPNICLFMGACTQPGNFFIVTEYLEAGDVEKLLRSLFLPLLFFSRQFLPACLTASSFQVILSPPSPVPSTFPSLAPSPISRSETNPSNCRFIAACKWLAMPRSE